MQPYLRPLLALACTFLVSACAPIENIIEPDPDTDDTDFIDTGDTDDTDLPVLEEARFYTVDIDYAPAVSDDGRVLLYDYRTADVYTWTEDAGLQWMANSGFHANYAKDISADGTVIIGNYGNYTVEGDTTQAAVWTAAEGWKKLGALPTTLACPTQSSGYALTADGKTAIGLAYDGCTGTAFRWTESEGFQALQQLGNGGNRATQVARDGSMLAGFVQGNSGRSPAVWFEDGTGMVLNMNWGGEFYDVNADGTLAAGELAGEAVVWSPESGQRFLGQLRPAPNPSRSQAYALCGAEDELILGHDNSGGDTAVIWTEETGLVKAKDYLLDLGVPVPESANLTWGFACSPDKRVLTGRLGADKAWIAIVPEHLYEPAE